MTITSISVPMVENILTFMGDQKLGINDLSFTKVLFILGDGNMFHFWDFAS